MQLCGVVEALQGTCVANKNKGCCLKPEVSSCPCRSLSPLVSQFLCLCEWVGGFGGWVSWWVSGWVLANGCEWVWGCGQGERERECDWMGRAGFGGTAKMCGWRQRLAPAQLSSCELLPCHVCRRVSMLRRGRGQVFVMDEARHFFALQLVMRVFGCGFVCLRAACVRARWLAWVWCCGGVVLAAKARVPPR